MGIGGWDWLADNVQLIGTDVDQAYSGNWLEGDDDWSITIKPAPGFEWVAKSNSGGKVECEICTPIDDANSENVQFGELMGQLFKAWGTWCEDVSHDHKNGTPPLDAPHLRLRAETREGDGFFRPLAAVYDHSAEALTPSPRRVGARDFRLDFVYWPPLLYSISRRACTRYKIGLEGELLPWLRWS
jgi:hypothetical protein